MRSVFRIFLFLIFAVSMIAPIAIQHGVDGCDSNHQSSNQISAQQEVHQNSHDAGHASDHADGPAHHHSCCHSPLFAAADHEWSIFFNSHSGYRETRHLNFSFVFLEGPFQPPKV